MSHVNHIARLKIELDDWRPVIWRCVEVPLTASLKALHDVIQAAMPFEDCHLFQFRADGKRFAIPDPEWDSLRDSTFSARMAKLGALVDRSVNQLSYAYDFGEDWRHTVTVEAVFAADPGADYPRYIDGARRGPPEDDGGIPSFELFVYAMVDPDHKQHDELMRWHSRPFDPEHLDGADSQARIAKLARRRAVGKVAFATSRGQVN
ncbi:plasmid pRiA4b ORF-3 family protein [Bosea sp. (in: a-proteobacteria)]